MNLKLYGGASSKMYLVLFVPNGMTSFSDQKLDKNLDPYWVRYKF